MDGLVIFYLMLHGLLAVFNGWIITRSIKRGKYAAEIKGDKALTSPMVIIVVLLSAAIAYVEVLLTIFFSEMLLDIILLSI